MSLDRIKTELILKSLQWSSERGMANGQMMIFETEIQLSIEAHRAFFTNASASIQLRDPIDQAMSHATNRLMLPSPSFSAKRPYVPVHCNLQPLPFPINIETPFPSWLLLSKAATPSLIDDYRSNRCSLLSWYETPFEPCLRVERRVVCVLDLLAFLLLTSH